MKKICLNCKTIFEAKRSDKKFCTTACKSKAWKSLNINPPLKVKVTECPNKIAFRHIEEGPMFDAIKQVRRTEDLFIFCHSMLWSTKDFSEEQQNSYKKLITEHFKYTTNVNETFKDLVEKVVLAKRHVLEKPYRFIAEPQDWLNIKFFQGLSAASKWHEALQDQRRISPDFGESLNIFAEAILNYAEQRNVLDIVFYRHVFITLKAWDLLQWYMNFVMHYQFINY